MVAVVLAAKNSDSHKREYFSKLADSVSHLSNRRCVSMASSCLFNGCDSNNDKAFLRDHLTSSGGAAVSESCSWDIGITAIPSGSADESSVCDDNDTSLSSSQQHQNIVRKIACFLSLAESEAIDTATALSMERLMMDEIISDEGLLSCSSLSFGSTDLMAGSDFTRALKMTQTTTRNTNTPSPEEELPSRGGNSPDNWPLMTMDDEDKERLQSRNRFIVQQRLSEAVFSHPNSLRSYCLEAQQQAQMLRGDDSNQLTTSDDPETLREPPQNSPLQQQRQQQQQMQQQQQQHPPSHRRLSPCQQKRLVRRLLHRILQNVPLSVTLQLFEGLFETTFQTTIALYRLTSHSLQSVLRCLSSIAFQLFRSIQNEHHDPAVVLQTLFRMPKSVVESTASGIVSVANSVGDAVSGGGGDYKVVLGTGEGLFGTRLRARPREFDKNVISEKMFWRLSQHDATARVISYQEREDDVLTQHAKLRVQRMMHYDVSLRPFTATVIAPRQHPHPPSPPLDISTDPCSSSTTNKQPLPQQPLHVRNRSLRSILIDHHAAHHHHHHHTPSSPPPAVQPCLSSSTISTHSSPFMCTPKSFPPTPSSRSLVMARGTRFAEDVIFLARDQLRLEDALHSTDDKTRAMAAALRQGSRLAVFNANDTAKGMALTKGQHCAMKIDAGMLYASTRAMIPLLRNCWVYFEFSVMPPPPMPHNVSRDRNIIPPPPPVASLSMGVSTLRMPLDHLVGMWKTTVGLCTSGQILTNGQLYDAAASSTYGNNSTVGCLVYIDDESAVEMWDGIMVTTTVIFNVNGVPVLRNSSMTIPHHHHHHHHHHGFATTYERQQQMEQQNHGVIKIPVPREEELFPTLTLHSPATQVMCRFCADDLLMSTTRENIGAPHGVPVYALDGSVLLFQEDIDDDDDIDCGLDNSYYTTDGDYDDDDDDDDYESDIDDEEDESELISKLDTIV